MTDSTRPETAGIDALADVTDEEAVVVDRAMDDHMYGHSISNSYNAFRCDVGCRTQALARAINKNVLAPRREATCHTPLGGQTDA